MDDNLNDLEAGIYPNIPRSSNKKMRKRKELDALLKFRLKKNNPNDILRSSEDELFLPRQKSSITKARSSRNYRCWNYFKQILSFSFICSFMLICIGLIYANNQLKSEVQNLSLRINEIEKQFSNIELKNISSTIEQIKTRLNFVEHWNFSFIYNQLQKLQVQMLKNDNDVLSSKLEKNDHKSLQFSTIANKLEKSNQEIENRLQNMINASVIGWYDQLNSLRNEIQNFNQTTKVQELTMHLEQLTNFVHNSSDKTSVILNDFQSNLDKLRNQIDECKCSKELIHSKPSVVDSDQLQQSIATKSNKNKKNEQIQNSIDEIVNQPSITG